MHIEQLKYLIEIGKCRSLNTASQNLNITYNGLRYSINALEEELGVKLINRTNKGCTLTKDGEQIVGISKKFFSDLSLVTEKRKRKRNNISGEIVLVLPLTILEAFMSKFIFDFEEKYPNLKINYSLIQNNNEQLFKESDSIYMFYMQGNALNNIILNECKINHMSIHKLYESSIHCTCSYKHELAKKKEVTIKQLQKYTLLYRSTFEKNDLYDYYFNKQHYIIEENPIVFENAILSGKYITLSSDLPIPPYHLFTHDYVSHVPIIDAPRYNIYLAYSQTLQSNERFRLFFNELENKLNCKIFVDN